MYFTSQQFIRYENCFEISDLDLRKDRVFANVPLQPHVGLGWEVSHPSSILQKKYFSSDQVNTAFPSSNSTYKFPPPHYNFPIVI